MTVATADGVMDAAPALSRKQIRSIAESCKRINVWTGAIRSGKTVASCLRWLMYVATASRDGELVMAGQTKDTIHRNVITVLQDHRLFGDLANETHYTPGSNTAYILGRAVHIIGAHNVTAEKRLRGLTVAGAYVDEATLVQPDFFTQMLGRMSIDGAQLFATTNPDNPSHWLRKNFLLRAHEVDLAQWHFTLMDNPWLSQKYRDNIANEFVGLFYRRFVLGHWVAAEGAVFDMWNEKRHVVETLPIITKWLACGIDYGTRNPFAALLIGLGQDARGQRNLYVTNEYRYDAQLRRRSMSDVEYDGALRLWLSQVAVPHTNPTVHGVRPDYTIVDPSAKSFLVQLNKSNAEATTKLNLAKANNAVMDSIRVIASLLARYRLLVHRSCEGLITELPGYSYDDKKALLGIDEPVKTGDHSIDALRYGVNTTANLWRPALSMPAL